MNQTSHLHRKIPFGSASFAVVAVAVAVSELEQVRISLVAASFLVSVFVAVVGSVVVVAKKKKKETAQTGSPSKGCQWDFRTLPSSKQWCWCQH